jgi:hypothetical protein
VHAGTDRARAAAGSKELDCADPRHTKLVRLVENIGAVPVELTPGDMRDIDQAAAGITVEGNRYPEQLERMTGR